MRNLKVRQALPVHEDLLVARALPGRVVKEARREKLVYLDPQETEAAEDYEDALELRGHLTIVHSVKQAVIKHLS